MTESAAPKRQRLDMTSGPIMRVLFAFTLPVLGASLLQNANSSINAMWVGRLLGEEALAATTNAGLILMFLSMVIFGVGLAATILVGQAIGAGDRDLLKRAVGTSVAFYAGVGVIAGALGVAFTDHILTWMGTPPEAMPLASAYLRVILFATPFVFLFSLLVTMLPGAGDPKTPFRFMALSALLDIVLNPVLITGWGPFPQLGIAGASAATLCAQALSLAAMVTYLYWRKSEIVLHRHELHYLRLDPRVLNVVVLKGLPMALQMAITSISAMMMMSMVNRHGAMTAAAFGVSTQILTYVQLPAGAIANACASFAAQNIGAGKWDRVERVARDGLLLNLAMTGAIVAIVYAFNHQISGLFFPGQARATDLAARITLITGWASVLFGMTWVLNSTMRAAGVVLPQLVNITLTFFLLRYMFAQAMEPHWGADAIWWSYGVASAAFVALTGAYFTWGPWRKSRLLAPARAPALASEAETP